MLLSNYKRLSYAGILLSAALIICEAALMTDDSGLNIDLGIGFDILWGVLLVLMFVFFCFPFFM
jgi:hypothetical protein